MILVHPLSWSTYYGRFENIALLLQHGANVNADFDVGKNSSGGAEKGTVLDVVEQILAGSQKEATEASARSKRKAGFTGIQGVLDKLSKFIADERGRVDREHKHDVDTARKQMEKEHAAQDLRLLREQQRLQGIVDRKTAVSLA